MLRFLRIHPIYDYYRNGHKFTLVIFFFDFSSKMTIQAQKRKFWNFSEFILVIWLVLSILKSRDFWLVTWFLLHNYCYKRLFDLCSFFRIKVGCVKKLILRNFETNQLVDRELKKVTADSLTRDQTEIPVFWENNNIKSNILTKYIYFFRAETVGFFFRVT